MMRVIPALLLVFLLGHPFETVLAADYTAASPSHSVKKVLKGSKNYTTLDMEDDESVDEDSSHNSNMPEEPSECTQADRSKLREQDKILTAYYEDSKFVNENEAKLESTQDFEKLQENLKSYMQFMASSEYQKSHKLRELCNMPAPPLPYEWPAWMGIPDPLKVGARD